MNDLRPARTTDAGAMGDILYRFQQETEWMPKLYTGAEMIAFAGAMIDRGWVTVAEVDGRVKGFIARDGEEVCALYVLPEVNQRGIGRRLLGHAKQSAERLWLKAFEANEWVHRFYARQGFVEQGRGDGSDNDENLPDITYVWTREVAKDRTVRGAKGGQGVDDARKTTDAEAGNGITACGAGRDGKSVGEAKP